MISGLCQGVIDNCVESQNSAKIKSFSNVSKQQLHSLHLLKVEVPLISEPNTRQHTNPCTRNTWDLNQTQKNFHTYIKEEIINFIATQERTNACHCTTSYYFTTSIM
jgi:hypothetical protein